VTQYQEENEGRLIKAAMGGDALPTPETERRVLRLLLAEQQAASQVAEFPTGILAALVGVLVVLIGLVLVQTSGVWVWAISSVPLAIAACMVCLNIAAVPVAGIVIVMRRRACLHV
jgi:hypothetical protein